MKLDELEKLAKEVEGTAYMVKRMGTLPVRELCGEVFKLIAVARAAHAYVQMEDETITNLGDALAALEES